MSHEEGTDSLAYYKKHLFICTNKRTNFRCCAQGDSAALHEYAKRRARAVNAQEIGRIRINRAGCMGRCEHGPVAVVYPDGAWYAYRTKADIDEIISEHIVNNRPVERLLLKASTTEPA